MKNIIKIVTTNTTTEIDGCGGNIEPTKLNWIEEAQKIGVPIIPKLPEKIDYSPCDPNPIVAICGECGLQIHRVMGYVCSNTKCPCGFGGATC